MYLARKCAFFFSRSMRTFESHFLFLLSLISHQLPCCSYTDIRVNAFMLFYQLKRVFWELLKPSRKQSHTCSLVNFLRRTSFGHAPHEVTMKVHINTDYSNNKRRSNSPVAFNWKCQQTRIHRAAWPTAAHRPEIPALARYPIRVRPPGTKLWIKGKSDQRKDFVDSEFSK